MIENALSGNEKNILFRTLVVHVHVRYVCIWTLHYGCFPFVRTDRPDSIPVIMRISLGINTIHAARSVNDSIREADGFPAKIPLKNADFIC